jgi:two-component system capsular synthesis response regulator RcsB
MAVTRITLADDTDLALIGARAVVSQDERFQVVGVCQSLPDLLDLIAAAAPDVILLGDRLEPDLDVLALVERVRATAPRAHLIVMGRLPDGLIVHELLNSGVLGYLYKSDRLEECLVEAIRAAARGKPYLSPTASAEFLLAVRAGRTDAQLDAEAREVLRLLAQGCRPQEIALMRGVPVRRIYWVGNKLRNRFGAETNEHLIARAAEEGFLS